MAPSGLSRWTRVRLTVLATAVAGLAGAMTVADAQTPAGSVRLDRAPVVIDGRTLFQLAGVSAAPASERVRATRDRIKALSRDASFDPAELSIVPEEGHTRIVAGAVTVVDLYDADAELEGVNRSALAAAVRSRIIQAIQSHREERSPDYLRTSAIVAVVTLLLLLAWVGLTRWLVRRVTAHLERRFAARVAAIGARSLEIVRAEQFWLSIQRAATAAWMLVVVASVLASANFVLSRLPWTRGLANWTVTLVLGPLRTMGSGLIAAVPDLMFIAILIVVIRYALRILQILFTGIATGAIVVRGFAADWALPTHALLKSVLVAFGIVVAFPYVPGSQSEAFKGVSIFVGVLVSLGSSSVIANTLAGYGLIYRRVFKVGDRVKIGDVVGDVVETRLQVTRIKTVKNEETTVPNSSILNREVVNYSSFEKTDGLVLHTTVGIGYETPWRQVEAMLLLAAERTPGLLKSPAPFVRQLSLGDFCVTYELNGYCAEARTMNAVYTDMHRHILDVFNEYGVQIMTPAYEGDPDSPKVVPRDQWHASPAQSTPPATVVEPTK